jgi:uncharacterized membrane protein YeaQ/YmgE (transglycosylase-associated protein family)
MRSRQQPARRIPKYLGNLNSSRGKIGRVATKAALRMHVTLYEFAVWFIVGLLGGTLAGLIVKREKRGFGLWANLVLGLAGALAGGFIFRLFGLFPNLDKISVSMRDIVAALAGSLLILVLYRLWQRHAPPR